MNPTLVSRRRRLGPATLVVALAAALSMLVQPAAHAANLDVTYDASGSTHIGAQVDADMPLGPTDIQITMDTITTQIVDGSLDIPSQLVTFDVFGIPTRATVTMTQVGPLTGTITPIPGQRGKNVLVSNVAYDIRLSNVQAKVFGIWWPLGVGSNCHTASPVQITASTPQGEYFTVLGGGRVTASYTIGGFTGCTPLNYFDIPGFFPWFGSIPVNTLVSGSDNRLELSLSNPRYGGA